MKIFLTFIFMIYSSIAYSATNNQLTSILSKYCVSPTGTCGTDEQASYTLNGCECKKCGYFYNSTSRKCEPCPTGQYVDNKYSTECKYPKCPVGTYIKVEKGVEKCAGGSYQLSPSSCEE